MTKKLQEYLKEIQVQVVSIIIMFIAEDIMTTLLPLLFS